MTTTATTKGNTMTPTQADYEKLARTYLTARGEDPGDWEEECIDENNKLVGTTRDTLDNFREGRFDWNEPGKMQEVGGGLYWERCQALKGQSRCELCVIDCGEFRLFYKI